MVEVGEALHAALAGPGRGDPVRRLLDADRGPPLSGPPCAAWPPPHPSPRGSSPRLEEWAGRPFVLATGDPWKARAPLSFARTMVVLKPDDRSPRGSDLGRAWKVGAAAFGR